MKIQAKVLCRKPMSISKSMKASHSRTVLKFLGCFSLKPIKTDKTGFKITKTLI